MKIANRVLLFVMVFLNLSFCFGQRGQHFFDVLGGVNMSNEYSVETVKYDYKFSSKLGIGYAFFITEHISLETNLLYNDLGANGKEVHFHYNGISLGSMDFYKRHTFVSMPVKIGFNYGNSIFGFVRLGLQSSYLLRSELFTYWYSSSSNNENTFVNQKQNLSHWDFAGIFELGGGFQINENLSLFNTLGFQFSVFPINRNLSNVNDIRIYAFSAALGLRYTL